MPPRRSTARRAAAAQNTTPTREAEPAPAPAPAPRRTRGRPRKAAAEQTPEPAADAAERVHALPTRVNPRLGAATPRQVKLQVIRREDKEIIIGRIKLPTVNGAEHGFLLKRFDTNAIAGSSMFRLAFPYADAETERAEMAYLEARFDTEVANGGLAHATHGTRSRAKKAALPPGSTGVRLQGVWIPCDVAAPIAADYGLLEIVQPLLDATAIKIPGDAAPVLNPDAATLARAADAAESAEEPAPPTRVSKRVRMRQVEDETPPRRMTRRTRPSTNDVVSVLSPAQVDAQIREAQSLAREIADEGDEQPRPSRKRRAEAEDEEQEPEAEAGAGEAAEREAEPEAEAEAKPEAKAEAEPEAKADAEPEAKEPAKEATNPAPASAPAPTPAPAPPAVRVQAPRPRRRLARAAGVLAAGAAGAAGAAALYAGGGLGLSGAVSQLQHLDYASALQAIQQNVASWNVASWLS